MDKPPARLSVDPKSPHYNPCVKRVDLYFNGVKRMSDVQEYDANEGWIDVVKKNAMGQYMLDEKGERIIKERLYGKVEPRFREVIRDARAPSNVQHDDSAALARAEAKRAEKAARRRKQMPSTETGEQQ